MNEIQKNPTGKLTPEQKVAFGRPRTGMAWLMGGDVIVLITSSGKFGCFSREQSPVNFPVGNRRRLSLVEAMLER